MIVVQTSWFVKTLRWIRVSGLVMLLLARVAPIEIGKLGDRHLSIWIQIYRHTVEKN